MITGRRLLVLAVICIIVTAFIPQDALATAQWSRKTGESCVTCHSAFPRLNYYGQRFMRNGYQDPDSPPDGDTLRKKELNDATFIGQLGDMVGVRLNLTPLQYRSNALDDDGSSVGQFGIGTANWVQLFVAGSIAKNISIFIEMQFDEKKYHYSWYKLGFHNLFDSSLANVIVGNLPTRDYGAYPNRLRIMGPVKGDIFGVKSSQGLNADANDDLALNASGYRPGITYYGYAGPVLGWGGVTPGNNGDDANTGLSQNDKLHYYGGLRLEVTEAMESPFEGSGVSVWAYRGVDTANFAGVDDPATPVIERPYENEYDRYSVETEIRYGSFEIMAAYLRGQDANWNLDASNVETTYDGVSIVGGYMVHLANGRLWYPALQYDIVNSDDVESLEKEFVTPSISYFPRENIRLGIYARIDISNADEKKHDIMANVRTMF